MKFFNFDDGFPYCAMICAESEDQAMKCYEEEVCDLEEGNGPANEITFNQAKEEYLSHAKTDEDKQRALEEFNLYIGYSEPTVLLIDSCLV